MRHLGARHAQPCAGWRPSSTHGVDVDRDSFAPGNRDQWFPYRTYVAVAGLVVLVSISAHSRLSPLHSGHGAQQGHAWYHAFTWWDGWWYTGIAERGYGFFSTTRQSPVAFFPGYPLLMRLLGPAVGGPQLAGFGLTVVSGLGAAVLFHRWCSRMLGPATARLAVWLLLLFPFAFYLMGAVYSDALFLLTVVGAFLAYEDDRPVLAGLLAAAASATRPVGIAVVLGLWVLALAERDVVRQLRTEGFASLPRTFRRADSGLLLAPVGLAAYCLFLWVRFGQPLAFLAAGSAHGWDQPPGLRTWLKLRWFDAMWNGPWDNGHVGHLLINAAAAVAAAALVPRVFRRLGLGYGVFVFVAVVLTATATKDFVGMGRYTLAAFPCFGVAADILIRRPKLKGTVLAGSAVGLLLLAQLHARGTLVS